MSRTEAPPSWAQLFKRATPEDRAGALDVVLERIAARHWPAVGHILDWASRAHRERLYFATQPVARTGKARQAMDSQAAALGASPRGRGRGRGGRSILAAPSLSRRARAGS
jgi:hypothetical protein